MAEEIDNELIELSLLALRNSYWYEFSMLTNKYIELSKGLTTDIGCFEMQLGEMTSVYGRDETVYTERLFATHIKLSDDSVKLVNGLADALKLQGKEIYFNGDRVFVWKDGHGWYWFDKKGA